MKYQTLVRYLGIALLAMGSFTSCSKDDSGSTHKPLLDVLVTRVKGTITDSDGNPLQGVQVTDGVTVQLTDGEGKYEFHIVDSLSKFVYMTTPSGYMFPQDNSLAGFYTKLRRRATLDDTVQIKNWTLHPTPTSDLNHIFIAFGDPQMRSVVNQQTFIQYFTSKMQTAYMSPEYPLIHIMTCGDLLSDRNDLNYLWNNVSQNIPIPIFNTIGNHDHNRYIASDDNVADDNYENSFGPTYYSFNRGKVHYIGLDNIFYEPNPAGTVVQQTYMCPTVTPRILAWLAKDIANTPADYTLVATYHCPITNMNGTLRTSSSYMNPIEMLTTLFGTVTDRKIHLVAGHTHTIYNSFNISGYTTVKEHVVGATCGAWWRDAGVCTDGAPNGYAVFDIKNADFTWYYKAFYDTTSLTTFAEQSHFTDYTTATGLSWQQTASSTKSNCVVVNVWNWDPSWKVQWNNNGTWTNMSRASGGAYDPVAYEAFKDLDSDNKASYCYHIFYATPPAGATTFQYRVTDGFQHVETITKNLTQAN